MAISKLKAKASTNTVVEQLVDIDTLVDNPRNPNKHGDEQLRRLMASLELRGQNRPVLARRENHMLIAGHGVRMAAKRLGWPTIKVALWDTDQRTADAAMLADNRLAQLSEADVDRVAELLREIPETDWLGVGFTDDEANKLMTDLQVTEVEVHEILTSTVYDTFWISIRGKLVDQANVLQRLKEVMGEYPGVTVEIGNTEDA